MNSCTGKVVDWILNVSKGEIDYGKKVLLCFMLGVATISSGCGKQVSSEKAMLWICWKVMILRSKTPS